MVMTTMHCVQNVSMQTNLSIFVETCLFNQWFEIVFKILRKRAVVIKETFFKKRQNVFKEQARLSASGFPLSEISHLWITRKNRLLNIIQTVAERSSSRSQISNQLFEVTMKIYILQVWGVKSGTDSDLRCYYLARVCTRAWQDGRQTD